MKVKLIKDTQFATFVSQKLVEAQKSPKIIRHLQNHHKDKLIEVQNENKAKKSNNKDEDDVNFVNLRTKNERKKMIQVTMPVMIEKRGQKLVVNIACYQLIQNQDRSRSSKSPDSPTSQTCDRYKGPLQKRCS